MCVLKNIKQERQQHAFDAVKAVDNQKKKEYKSAVESFGMIVYTNGLISLLASYKKKNPSIYNQLHNWLHHKGLVGSNNSHFLEEIIAIDSGVLMQCTKETIMYSDALKEMTKAIIND